MDEKPPAIALKDLSKQYRGTKVFALKNVSLNVMPGEVYGFLGPNGAGKSTTIRCLLNFIHPTTGSATILDSDIVKDSVNVKKHVGYLSGDVNLYPRMTGRQFLDYMAQLQPPKRANYLKVLTRAFRADLGKPIEQLSKGNRQKVGILQAFMHEPDILILDEPTSGLDPLMQEQFYDLVHETKARGGTLFISSHNLGEVRRMCDRIGFIKDGKLVAQKDMAELALTAAHTFDLTFSGPAPIDAFKQLKQAKIKPSPDPKHITIQVKGQLAPFFTLLSRAKVMQIEQRELNLEDEFLHLYEKDGKP